MITNEKLIEKRKKKILENHKIVEFSRYIATNEKNIPGEEYEEFCKFREKYSPELYLGIYADYQSFGLTLILHLRQWNTDSKNLFVLLENRGSGFKSLNDIRDTYKNLFKKHQMIYNAFTNNEFVSGMLNQRFKTKIEEIDENFSTNRVYILKSLLRDGIVITTPNYGSKINGLLEDYNPRNPNKKAEIESIFLALSDFQGDDSFFTNMYLGWN